MFENLATPEEDKKHIVYSSRHYVPRDELLQEDLGWLSKYLDE